MDVVWLIGSVLVLLALANAAAGVHAGGHAIGLSAVSVALCAGWMVVAATRGWQRPLAWVLAGLLVAAAAVGLTVARAALRVRRLAPRTGAPTLAGAEGTAVTALEPDGIVRVAGETWSARSLSGPLPAGAPVHVVAARGVTLEVWSELGQVPGSIEGVRREDGSGPTRGEEPCLPAQ